MEPIEWLGSDKAAKQPRHSASPHPKYRLHSQMNKTWLREIYEVAGREPMRVNIANKALVEVEKYTAAAPVVTDFDIPAGA